METEPAKCRLGAEVIGSTTRSTAAVLHIPIGRSLTSTAVRHAGIRWRIARTMPGKTSAGSKAQGTWAEGLANKTLEWRIGNKVEWVTAAVPEIVTCPTVAAAPPAGAAAVGIA